MPNYNESNITGTKYTRSHKVVVRNDLGQTPNIHFNEQEVAILGENDKMVKEVGGVGTAFTAENASTQFDLIHPDTGAVVGTAAYQDVYVLLHSLYYHLAVERDNAALTPEAPV